MNESVSLASTVSGPRIGGGGLPQRPIQDGVIDEAAAEAALQAAHTHGSSFVTQLIAAGAADARVVSAAAASEFGVPVLDLEPLIMGILGVLVGGLAIAMYLPIFKMGSVV